MMRSMLPAALFPLLCFAQQPAVEQLFSGALEAQQRGDFAAAVRGYQEVVKLEPQFFGAWANLGVALVRLGRFDEAADAYRTALKLDGSNAALRMNLALAFYKKGDARNAAAELETLRKGAPGDPRIAALLGDCYLQLGDKEQALGVSAPAAQAYPEDLDLAYVYGRALIETGKLRDGIPLVERVAKGRESADAYALAGKAWLKVGDADHALKDLEQAARIDPRVAGIHTLRGIAREGTFDEKGAESDLRKALELNRNDLEAAVHLGGILYARRDLDGAKVYLDRALEIDPSSQFARYEMALWKSASGKVKEAVADLESVVKGDPNWIEAHVQLAALYYRLHRPEEGLKERQIVDRLTAEQRTADLNAIRK